MPNVTTSGLIEVTGVASATTRTIGVASGTHIPTAADVDTKIAAAGFLQTSVDSIADLTALAKAGLPDDHYVVVKGYYTPGDGGGGLFQWDAASTATTNVGTVFAADEGGTGRWLRDYRGYSALNTRWFGATHDGTTDDTAAIQAAIDLKNGPVYIAPMVSLGAVRGTIVTQLKIYNGTHLFGAGCGIWGWPGSRLKQKDGSNLSLIIPDQASPTNEYLHNVNLHDFSLEGSSTEGISVPAGTSTAGCGIDLNRRLGETFRCYNLNMRNFAESGIRITKGATPGTFENISSFQNGEYGFHFEAEPGNIWHQFSANRLSGDDNGIALIYLKQGGNAFDLHSFMNIKAETFTAGRQQDVFVIDLTNYVNVRIQDVAQQNVGAVTSNSIVKVLNTSGARLDLKNIRTSLECANWIDDEFKGVTLARSASPGQTTSLVEAYWDSSQNNPAIHVKFSGNFYHTDRLNQVGTAAPTTGTHYRGEIVYNTAPTAGGTLCWVCVAAGEPGTWAAVTLS